MIGNPLPKQPVPGFEPTILSAPPLDLSGGRGRGGSRGGGNRDLSGPRATAAAGPGRSRRR